MYTDEDKVFYVKRMWAEGLTPTAASRLWGVPSRRTLAAWEKEALGGGLAVEAPRVPGACKRAKHARYPEETRAEALRLLGLGKPTREIARALGLPSGSVVSRWAAEARRRAKMAPEAIAMGEEKGAPDPREAELDRLRMECAVLREMLSDPKAGDPARLSNRQKAELGERLRRDYGFRLRRVTAFLRISKSSYEYERRALAAPRRDDGALAARVARAFASLGGMCGYRKVAACIRAGADGEPPAPAPERRVRRAMREGGMSARGRRAGRRFSSYAGEVDGGRPANVPRERAVARREAGEDFRLAHDFSAGAPGELLVTDVTEFSLNGFKAYLSPVIDCWGGCPVGFSVSAHPDGELWSSSLREALACLPAGSAPVVHTDGGACYRTERWKSVLAAAGASRSMSRKGTCPDNTRGRRASLARSSRSSSTAGSGRASGARSSRGCCRGTWGGTSGGGPGGSARGAARATRPWPSTGGGPGTHPAVRRAAGAVEWARAGTRFLPQSLSTFFVHRTPIFGKKDGTIEAARRRCSANNEYQPLGEETNRSSWTAVLVS